MSDATPPPFDLPAVSRKKLTVSFDGGNLSSDAGVLLLRAAEHHKLVFRWSLAALSMIRVGTMAASQVAEHSTTNHGHVHYV